MDHPSVEIMLQRDHTQFGFYRKQNHLITVVGEKLTKFTPTTVVNCFIKQGLYLVHAQQNLSKSEVTVFSILRRQHQIHIKAAIQIMYHLYLKKNLMWDGELKLPVH